MQYRRFGRTNWNVSEIGYGMWGMAGWTGSDLDEVRRALDRSVELGCNFYDTAWAYGAGKSEQLLGELVRRHPNTRLYCASKIPAKNFKWPARPEYKLEDCYPADHIIEYTEKTLKNLGVDCLDLQQFHVWDDSWTDHDAWKEGVEKLRREGKIRAFGISINRWEPDNALRALRTGLVDTVQVIYNIFDQAPEDNLFPLCRELDIGVIARVPFDEGTLTGTLTRDTVFPKDDWRSTYFVPENLKASVERAEKLRPLIPEGMTMPELALRFILDNDDVHTTIPGMRRVRHVEANLAVSDGSRLPASLKEKLKGHRWDRVPTEWSQ
ncbi:MAG: aldo/keto reductase [Cyclobacteriaceae bacterium]|jgi:aryl-alcohol dehydrogenase-like predicted oxidoreductase|nr:aldo/keto reductase [Cyclobacteriaceae bacterium]